MNKLLFVAAIGAAFYMVLDFATKPTTPVYRDGVYQGNDPRFTGMRHSTYLRCLVEGDPCHLIGNPAPKRE